MKENEVDQVTPANPQEWRAWLQENYQNKQSVWLVYHKKKAGQRNLTWSEAVDEALCFGWIDSTSRPIDEYTYRQFFSKRKVVSTWSKVNKNKVEKLIEEGKMTKAGLDIIELAKQNGSWTILDAAEDLIIPEDLDEEFDKYSDAKEFFLGLSKSVRKNMLHWIVLAKRDETRQKRIAEIAELASQKRKPKQF